MGNIRFNSDQLDNKNSGHCSLFLFALLILSTLSLSACQPNTQKSQAKDRIIYSGPMMGTQYRITVLLDQVQNEEEANIRNKRIEESVVAAMNSVNSSMSTYINDSELSLLNKASSQQAVTLSSDLHQVIEESLLISRMSEGAFDITLGKAVSLWGFGADGRIEIAPSDEILESLFSSVGYQHIALELSLIHI